MKWASQNAAGKMTLGQASEVIMMLLMPFILRRWNREDDSAARSAGVVGPLHAAGISATPGRLVWIFYLAILLHGICYDFFFMTGQLYTDQEAPAHLRGTAQGFIQFLTYGVGMFLGSVLSGVVVDIFSTGSGATVTRDWRSLLDDLVDRRVCDFPAGRGSVPVEEEG